VARFIVFDVETPNRKNNRMSAIGITVVEEGKISKEFYSLVNPEADFDYFNVKLTGISRASVKDAPTFSDMSHKLNMVCGHFGIPLNHHRADSDSHACAEILLRYLEAGAEVKDFIRTCSFKK